ncbi:MAG: YfaP family protein [Bacteroidales bacterium]
MKKQITLISALMVAMLIGINLKSVAQIEKGRQTLEDVIAEQEQNIYTLRFFNALTGDPVQGGQVMIENIGTFETDSAGRVLFPRQPDGLYKTIFKMNGYITAVYNVDIVAGTIFKNRLVVSPIMDISQFRVVLDWDQQPLDLDAHFVKANTYHISYRNTRVLADGTGMLDRDDMDGYGPETITVERIDTEGEYGFFAHNYSAHEKPGSPSLSVSKATVRVYSGNRLLKSYQVPDGLTEKTWNVFKVINGQVEEW